MMDDADHWVDSYVWLVVASSWLFGGCLLVLLLFGPFFFIYDDMMIEWLMLSGKSEHAGKGPHREDPVRVFKTPVSRRKDSGSHCWNAERAGNGPKEQVEGYRTKNPSLFSRLE